MQTKQYCHKKRYIIDKIFTKHNITYSFEITSIAVQLYCIVESNIIVQICQKNYSCSGIILTFSSKFSVALLPYK